VRLIFSQLTYTLIKSNFIKYNPVRGKIECLPGWIKTRVNASGIPGLDFRLCPY